MEDLTVVTKGNAPYVHREGAIFVNEKQLRIGDFIYVQLIKTKVWLAETGEQERKSFRKTRESGQQQVAGGEIRSTTCIDRIITTG